MELGMQIRAEVQIKQAKSEEYAPVRSLVNPCVSLQRGLSEILRMGSCVHAEALRLTSEWDKHIGEC